MAIFARRLEAGRLSLECVFDHDRPDITDYTAAPEYRRYQPRRHRQRDRRAALGISVPLIQHPTGSVCYALRRCGSATAIGNVAASGIDARGVMTVGWSLIPAARGQGYGTEAALLLRDLLFCTHPQLRLLVAQTFAAHTVSRRVMETLGMTRQRLPWRSQARVQWDYREWRPIVQYYLHRTTWESLQA
jgi:RimJ/RimL family protein N-acetyltransferase